MLVEICWWLKNLSFFSFLILLSVLRIIWMNLFCSVFWLLKKVSFLILKGIYISKFWWVCGFSICNICCKLKFVSLLIMFLFCIGKVFIIRCCGCWRKFGSRWRKWKLLCCILKLYSWKNLLRGSKLCVVWFFVLRNWLLKVGSWISV